MNTETMIPDSLSPAPPMQHGSLPALLPSTPAALPDRQSGEARAVPATIPDQDFWKVAETAALLRLSKMTIYRMIRKGQLESLRFGNSIRIRGSSIRDYIREAEENGQEMRLIDTEIPRPPGIARDRPDDDLPEHEEPGTQAVTTSRPPAAGLIADTGPEGSGT